MATSPRKALLAALLGVLLCACASSQRQLPSAEQLESEAIEARQEYVIGEGDVLRINVWRQPELSEEMLTVRQDGKISIPLLDDVQAAGLTPRELKQVLTERLSEFVVGADVTVIVREIGSKIVYVLGEVQREGALGLRADMRVVNALSMAGGFRPFAGKKSVKIIRNADGKGPIEFQFNYESFVDGSNVEQNILLLPGDTIIVPEESPFWR